MKRARSSSSPSLADSEDDSLHAGDSLSVPSSPTSSSDSEVAQFEEPTAAPLLTLLEPVLVSLKATEIFAEALKRLARENSQSMAQLTELHQTLLAQHGLVLMHMPREAILLKALEAARQGGRAVTPAWMLRWSAKADVEHGPFTDAKIQAWGREGFFAKKPAELRNLNAVNPPWVPALRVVEESA